MQFGAGSSAASVRSTGALTQSSSIKPSNCPDVYIRRADIDESLEAYERLLGASKAYTSTMLAMSKASSDLAQALEDCSRVKGAHACGPEFQAACGLHYLKSNYEQVLCDTFWKEFSIPLLSQLDVYRNTVRERQSTHEKAIAEKSRLLKDIEARHQKEGKQRKRDLNSYRLMLSELQEKINELDDIKSQHYTDALEYEEQTWEFLSSKVALLVRAQVEIAERLSSKANSDPVLESITATIPDPFNTYGPPKKEGELFTILQPTGTANHGMRVVSEDHSGANSKHLRPQSQDDNELQSPSQDHETDASASGNAQRNTLFSPPMAVQDGETPEVLVPSRAFLASQLHSQPSYGSLFGYSTRADTSSHQDGEQDNMADTFQSKLSVSEKTSDARTPPAPLSPQQHWPSDREMWE